MKRDVSQKLLLYFSSYEIEQDQSLADIILLNAFVQKLDESFLQPNNLLGRIFAIIYLPISSPFHGKQ